MTRDYQYNFSCSGDAMYDVLGRQRKARTMVAVLAAHCDTPLNALNLLNVGGSTGIIDSFLADHFDSVTGIDIDIQAIEYAQQSFTKNNLAFFVGDALCLDFAANTFDVVICSQVYEHVPDAHKMMGEIYRVLKPGGVCYFAASNRLMWNEPHYNLPLLSVIPRPLAHVYIRLAGKADFYHEQHYTYWELRDLVRQFVLHDYTVNVIKDPEKYVVDYMIKRGTLKSFLAKFLVKHFYWLSPGYIWVLEKSN